MSKAVMLSIRPKWAEKIANGEKTIEVRKTRPKLDTPFKCYIYCTLQGCNEFFRVDLGGDVAKWNRGKWADRKGKIIGEFTCDRIYELETKARGGSYYVKGEDWLTACEVAQQSCLTLKDMHDYLHAQTGYGWHITDLRIYDAPKCLLSFGRKGFADASQASSGAENVAIAISARRRVGAMWRRWRDFGRRAYLRHGRTSRRSMEQEDGKWLITFLAAKPSTNCVIGVIHVVKELKPLTPSPPLMLPRWCMGGGARAGSIWKRETMRSSAPAAGISRKSTASLTAPTVARRWTEEIVDG